MEDLSLIDNTPAMTSFDFYDGKAHTLRYLDMRYIFYPATGMEELYDHVSDPGEFTNLAYDPRFREQLVSCRKDMEELIPDLDISKRGAVPDGYSVKDGRIRKDNFLPLTELDGKRIRK
jgi:hypothetical protein